jgi:hypothetical protein
MVRTVFVVALLFLTSAFAVGQNKGNCPARAPISANPGNPSEDNVSVLVLISDTGYVCSAEVLHGVDKLTDAEAVKAVRGRQYRTYTTRDGHPVSVALVVKFRRDDNGKLVFVSQPPKLQMLE